MIESGWWLITDGGCWLIWAELVRDGAMGIVGGCEREWEE